MTKNRCLAHCHSFDQKYAGMQNKRDCFCGDATTIYDRYGRANEGDCNTKCNGDKEQVCGGLWRISMYILGKIRQNVVLSKQMWLVTAKLLYVDSK